MISFATPAGAIVYHDADGLLEAGVAGLLEQDLEMYVPYTVEKLEIGSSYSSLYLKEFPGKPWNTLWFVNDPLVPVSQNDDDSPWLGAMNPITFERVGL